MTDDAPIEIRDMGPDDRDAVANLLLELNHVENAISGDRHVAPEAGWACLAENERWIAAHGGAILVAADSTAPVGALVLCFDAAETFVQPALRPFGLVADLVVTERARGRGVGRLLLDAAERRTRAAGLTALRVGALLGNDPALRLYEGFGFRPQSVELVKPL